MDVGCSVSILGGSEGTLRMRRLRDEPLESILVVNQKQSETHRFVLGRVSGDGLGGTHFPAIRTEGSTQMIRRCWLLVAFFTLAVGSSPQSLAQEAPATEGRSDIEAQIKSTVLENIRSTQAEDVDAMMKTIHSKSPMYETTKKQVGQIFGKGLNLNYDLVSFKYIATDGDYALGRVHQRTTVVGGPNFRNNEIDMIVAFRKEGETWKFWSQAILEIKFLNK